MGDKKAAHAAATQALESSKANVEKARVHLTEVKGALLRRALVDSFDSHIAYHKSSLAALEQQGALINPLRTAAAPPSAAPATTDIISSRPSTQASIRVGGPAPDGLAPSGPAPAPAGPAAAGPAPAGPQGEASPAGKEAGSGED